MNQFTGNAAKNGCLSHLATLQKWLFKSCGEIPLVMLVFAGGSFLVSRLIARHVPFEILLFAKMSAKIFFASRIKYLTIFLLLYSSNSFSLRR